MSTWQQVKQQEAITISTPKPASIYFQTKPFVKASTKEGTVKVFVVNLENSSLLFYFIKTHILKLVVYDIKYYF